MNIKIIGTGKCGSRICYDFFAHIRDLPTAYEIRSLGSRSRVAALFNKLKQGVGFDRLSAQWRAEWQRLTGWELLADNAFYVIVDSDFDDNEITQNLMFYAEHDAKTREYVFPGTSHALADHTTGCDFHVVSENICAAWPPNGTPAPITSLESADIIAYAFSIGGGTGGGASPQLARKMLDANPNNNAIHLMGVGVLPKSEEPYFPDATLDAKMDPHEKYNVGRFFTGWYGGRNATDDRSVFNSLWLVSNDILTFFEPNGATKRSRRDTVSDGEEALQKRGMSLINTSLGSAMCTLCNASSSKTRGNANFDTMEMSNRFNGHPFISGHAAASASEGADTTQDVFHVHALFGRAISNPSFDNHRIYGLSLPQRDDEMRAVRAVFAKETYDPSDLEKRLSAYEANDGPLAFRTAPKVVVLYGQADGAQSPFRQALVERIAGEIFSNSDISFYHYRHPGTTEYLVVFVINPFVRAIQNSLYYYIGRAWCRENGDLTERFDKLLLGKTFHDKDIESQLSDDEIIDSDFVGEKTAQLLSKMPDRIPFTKQHVVRALKELHAMLHHRKTDIPRSRI